MLGSIQIGSILGITIRVHGLLLALAAFFCIDRGLAGALGFALLFLVVLLHELGHSIVAQRLGIRVVDITLWPLGGMARMSSIPESSKVEGWIAVAGPVVNFVLAALTFAVLVALGSAGTGEGPLAEALRLFLEFNLALGVFNLVPAFPNDGGRILRSVLALSRDWLAATELAVRVGSVVAFACIVVGCVLAFSALPFLGLGISLVLVGAFLWITGRQELAAVRARHGVSPFANLAALLRRTLADAEPARAPAERSPADAGLSPQALADLERYRGDLSSWRARRDDA